MRRRSLVCVPVALLLLTMPGVAGAQDASLAPSPVPSPADAAAVTLIAQSIAATRHADTMHISISGTGSMPDGNDGTTSLDGTSMEADLDVVDQALAATLDIPALDMTGAELRIVDGQAYLKADLMTDDGTYMAMDAETVISLMASMIPGGSRILNGDPPQKRVEGIVRRRLGKANATAAVAGEQACSAGTCTLVRIEAPVAADFTDLFGMFGGLGAMASPAPAASGAPAQPGMTVDLLVDTATTRLESIVMTQRAGSSDLTLTIAIDAYDAPVTVEAPPADQVSDFTLD